MSKDLESAIFTLFKQLGSAAQKKRVAKKIIEEVGIAESIEKGGKTAAPLPSYEDAVKAIESNELASRQVVAAYFNTSENVIRNAGTLLEALRVRFRPVKGKQYQYRTKLLVLFKKFLEVRGKSFSQFSKSVSEWSSIDSEVLKGSRTNEIDQLSMNLLGWTILELVEKTLSIKIEEKKVLRNSVYNDF